MSSTATIRVLRDRTKLLGKVRSFGETIPEADYAKISPHVRKSLINEGVIEVLQGNLTDDRLQQMLNDQALRIDKLEAQVKQLTDLVAKAQRGADVVSLNPTQQNNPPKEEIFEEQNEFLSRKARKGDRVQFEIEGDDNNLYILDGVVDSVSKGIAAITADNNVQYEMEVDKIQVIKQ